LVDFYLPLLLLGLVKTAAAGAAGGVALWTAIFPADVVKSRMQIQGGTAKQVTMDVLKNEGAFFEIKNLFQPFF
jgi:hypothetical protein